ncbi:MULTISPECIES: C10 family peptidase [Bacteroidales]|uniref:Peptidase C10-like protein n=3 Tax=Porphyromonas loveana TaxID=1884669 RepID=A0A2U1F807_9PORP|nr:C10 family peptidase [Porphyromonas loveana]PVZ08323.1 peptidase C10-like protein [Porphyromonas loveana]
MKKKILIGLAIVAGFTACTKEAFESHENGLPGQQSTERTFEEKIKAFAVSDFVSMQKERGRSFADLPNVQSLEPIVTVSGLRSDSERDTVAYIVNFDRDGSIVVAGSRILPLSTVAFSDSRMALNDTIQNKGLALFIRLLPNYYYQEIGQRIIDFGLATKEEVEGYTRNEFIQFTDQLSVLGDTPSPLYPITININDYINGTITSDAVISFQKTDNLLNVIWGQRSPFNLMAETFPNSYTGELEPAPAGCVAIAIGQITTGHQHPKILNGQTLDWSVLSLPEESDFDNDYKKQTIASYIRTIGDYCNNNWGYLGTNASSEVVPGVFARLGYTSTKLLGYNRDLIQGSLQNGNAVYFSGKVYGSPVGHAWVIEGSVKKTLELHFSSYGSFHGTTQRHWTYFYCNWGWNGNHNGYFLDNVFNTAHGYSYYDAGGGFLSPNSTTYEENYTVELSIVANITQKN